MNTKHTPGPWTIDGAQVYADGYVYTSSTVDDDLVVEVNTSTRPYGLLTETDKANLALIAAAPDLLAALKGVMQEVDFLVADGTLLSKVVSTNANYGAAHAAIAKATT